MAFPPYFSTFLRFFVLFVLFSPAISLTCTTQKFSNNRPYPNCQDLPVLNSYLHWDYDPSNSSLSIAFVAAPAQPGGWVSWAINPTGTGMAGAQALMAFQNNGVMTVMTYDISSYDSILPGKLSFDVWDMMAEESDGLIKIFAKIKVPEKAQSLNQVWQVGSTVTDGRPDVHSFEPANINAKGILSLNSSQIFSNGGVDETTRKKNLSFLFLLFFFYGFVY